MGCSVQNKSLIFKYKVFTFILLIMSVNSQAADLPPLTHNLTAFSQTVKAPLLQFKNLDDELISIEDMRGKVVIVNFWATWCPPCRREMGSLEKLHLKTVDKNVVLLAVNIGEDAETVFSFMGEIEPFPTFPILFDPDADSMAPWKVRGLPTTFIVDPDGNLAYRAVGGREFDHPDIINQVMSLHKKY